MRKLRSIALGVVSAFVVVATPVAFVGANPGNPQTDNVAKQRTGVSSLDATAAAASPICKRQSAANSAGQDIFLSTGDYKTYTGTAWQNVNCASTSFRLANGQRAIVIADFNAEADCNGSTNSFQWCETRALLNGAEGAPVAAEPSSFAFDSEAGGTNNWQAHSMERAWEVRCATTTGCQYKFAVQTKMHAAGLSGMWLDEVATHIRVNIGAVAPL
jgi:hypothetical protein